MEESTPCVSTFEMVTHIKKVLNTLSLQPQPCLMTYSTKSLCGCALLLKGWYMNMCRVIYSSRPPRAGELTVPFETLELCLDHEDNLT